MAKLRFKQTVLHAMSFLAQFGYQFQEPRVGGFVPFQKIAADGTTYEIEFQLVPQFMTPTKRWMNIDLFRRCLAPTPGKNSRCTPLAIDLSNLLRMFYQLNIFPPGTYIWEFSDEKSLTELLANVKVWLVGYGIKWLEDPKSNIDWVKQPQPKDLTA
jgi:hypothetical protein